MNANPGDPSKSKLPIAVFDSGIGGLSILRELQLQLPGEDFIYLADQAHVPYGSRALEEVRELAYGITSFLLAEGTKLITVACNTASAASLHALRQRYPDVPFVGMEPAVKPAVANTRSRTVGVLATPTTFQGALFASVVERFAEGVTVLEETLPGLVEQIEAGELDSPRTRAILEQGVQPLLDQGADTLVLACTHFPFIIPTLEELVGGDVQVIDPSPAIARQVGRVLKQETISRKRSSNGLTRYITTGAASEMNQFVQSLGFHDGEIAAAVWKDGRLYRE